MLWNVAYQKTCKKKVKISTERAIYETVHWKQNTNCNETKKSELPFKLT